MLNQTRLSRILEKINTDCLLITDPLSIAYLCEKKIEPGGRFLGLLIGKEITPVLVLNRLFRFDEEIGIETEYYTDTDKITDVLKKLIKPEYSLGVDKILPAKFLIPMMEEKIASEFKLGSLAVDKTVL